MFHILWVVLQIYTAGVRYYFPFAEGALTCNGNLLITEVVIPVSIITMCV